MYHVVKVYRDKIIGIEVMDVKLDGDANVVVKKKQSNVDDGMIDYILPVLRLTNG